MSKPREADDDFVMYLNSGDRGTHPLEPGVTTVHSTFMQELEIPLSLSPDWQVAFAQYVLHALVRQCSVEIVHRFSLSNGKDSTGWVPHRHPLPIVSQRTVHPRRASVGRHDSTIGFAFLPTLSGGTHYYGQLHMDPLSSYYEDFPTNPELDYFRCDLVDGWLANHLTLPSTYLEMKTYINDATTTLMGGDNVKYIWTLKPGPSKPSTHYAIDLWAEGIYDMGKSLAQAPRGHIEHGSNLRRQQIGYLTPCPWALWV